METSAQKPPGYACRAAALSQLLGLTGIVAATLLEKFAHVDEVLLIVLASLCPLIGLLQGALVPWLLFDLYKGRARPYVAIPLCLVGGVYFAYVALALVMSSAQAG